MSDAQQHRQIYDAFARAWQAKDVEELMRLVTDDIVYGASVGPEPGRTYRGRDEVRVGFAELLAYDNARAARVPSMTFARDRLFAEWEYDIADGGGGVSTVRGIDIIGFRDGKICLKEAFRKAPAIDRDPADQGIGFRDAPYSQRRFGSLGTWEIGPMRLKAYGINVDTNMSAPLLQPDVTVAARAHAMERIQATEREAGRYNLGYVIVHVGAEAIWLLMDWWVEGGIACHLLSCAQMRQPTRFEIVDRPLMACVWEMKIIGHERDAWVRHMLSGRPDPAAYCRDRHQAGLH